MAGYSGTPLWRKLSIRPGHAVTLLGAPPDWGIGELPEGVVVRRALRASPDVIVAFFRESAALRRRLPALVRAAGDEGAVWIAWPRKAAGHVSDISENGLREAVLPTGLVDVKVAALDDDWSALKFVRRRALRTARGAGQDPR